VSRILIVGGSDAGVMAALKAREVDPSVEVAMMLADRYPNFSVCGLPFFLSGEVADWEALAHRSAGDITARGIELLPGHLATGIDLSTNRVLAQSEDGLGKTLAYDTLIIATGARSRVAGIEGIDLPGVHALHTMADGLAIRARLDAGEVERAVVIGAGYIGVEMADALARRGIEVVLAGKSPTVMPTVDASLAEPIREELERNGVEVVMGTTVGAISTSGTALEVRGEPGFSRRADLVLVAGGVGPNSDLATGANIATGPRRAIRVDRQMRTSAPRVLAAGDCVETWHRILQEATYLPLGTTAHKQGRVAGEVAAGGDRSFQGSLGTQVVKVFELAVARTGLRDEDARQAGFAPLTVEAAPWHHKAYYPGAQRLHMRVTGDLETGRLLGAQIVGHWQAEVAKRIDVFASALFHASAVDGLNDLDLSYTPPMGAPWDAVQEAAQAWLTAARALRKGKASQ
jgi:NADPH-dependent 2,4-dienoyl-CoA reductase/sulfur reductase-like enzyme